MGGGGGSSKTYVKADAPEVYTPLAPERTSAEAMPDNMDQALLTTGSQETEEQKKQRIAGTSRLVIPLEGNTQSGGYEEPRKPTGVV